MPSSLTLRFFNYAEKKRIKFHLMHVERELGHADTSHLGKESRVNRERMLQLLNEYWKKEEFPRNTDYKIKTPQIRDRYGTPCAVAYMVERSGHGDLVNQLAAQNNLVRINDVKDGPLIGWLERFGLSKREAARIQPGYDTIQRDIVVLLVVAVAVVTAAVGLFVVRKIMSRRKPSVEKE